MARQLFDDPGTTRLVFQRVITIALLALFCAALLLSVVNDMYAFFKPQGTVMLTVSEPCSLIDFARLLERNGILLNPHVFSLYVKSKDRVPLVEGWSGTLVLDTDMSYREILLALSENFSHTSE